LQALQNDEDKLAEEQGRDARTVTTPDRAAENGDISQEYCDELKSRGGSGYDHENHPDKIFINDDYIADSKPHQRESEGSSPTKENQFDARSAVAHEGRHATQEDAKNNPEIAEKNGFSEGDLKDFDKGSQEATNMERSMDNNEKYRNLPHEKDANDFASSKVYNAEQDQKFSGDPDYKNGKAQDEVRNPGGSDRGSVESTTPQNTLAQGNSIQSTEQGDTTPTASKGTLNECNNIQNTEQAADKPTETTTGKDQSESVSNNIDW
jgi:hypothetical protein